MNQMQAQAMERVGELAGPIFRTPCSVGSGEVDRELDLYDETTRCETCCGTGRVVETIDVDVPGHNRAGSYDVTVTCDDCAGEGRTAIAAATEGAES